MSVVHEIKDKVVLITGATGGLGSLMVEAFLREGAKHVAILDVAKTAGEELEKKFTNQFGENKVKFYNCDVTKEEQLFAAFQNTIDEQGGLDVVINNAGILNDSKDVYKKEIEINVTAVVTGTLKALEVMGKDVGGTGGTVINISSTAAFVMHNMFPIYHATKSAVLMFSNCIGLHSSYERTGVRVLTTCFGSTDTSIFDDAYKKVSWGPAFTDDIRERLKQVKLQKPESAIRCVIESYKAGESGDTWLSVRDRPPENITSKIKEAYGLLNNLMI